MKVKKVVGELYQVNLGFVNAYVMNRDELSLIDTGMPGNAKDIVRAIQELGKEVSDLRHIVVTHLHADHTGSLAELARQSGATVYMHAQDAKLVAAGRAAREMNAAPGLLSRLASRMMSRRGLPALEPCKTDVYLEEGDTLGFAGGMEVIHAPGHAAGQIVLRWPEHGGVLVAADAASHFTRLGYPIVVENLGITNRTLRRLCDLEFQAACFGHGRPITQNARASFRRRFANV